MSATTSEHHSGPDRQSHADVRLAPHAAPLADVAELVAAVDVLTAELRALEQELSANAEAPTVLAINKLQAVVGEIEIAGVLAHRIARDLHHHVNLPGVRCSFDDERLSEREREVLRMLANGCTVSEIATRLAINVKTVSTYRLRALRKLQLVTTAQLVRYGITHHFSG